jgi:DNA polymerase-3 subunit delta
MSRTPPTFYVLHGEDEFSRKNAVHNMRASMGDPSTAELNTEVFDGKATPAAKVVGAASSMPFLADKRLVIVEGMLTWLSRKGSGKTGKAELDVLLSALPNLPDTARLVFVEPATLNDSNPVLKLAREDPHGYEKAFNPPRDATAWIRRQVEAYGGQIEPQAAAALAAVVGPDLRAADSECVKLLLYVNGERPISEADVALLTPYVAEAVIWDMVDALGRREGRQAARLIHRLLDDSEPLYVLSMINRQFRLLIEAREVLDAGGDSRDLLRLPDFKSPNVAQKLIQQARNFTMPQLESIYRYLLETDYAIKTGRVKDDLALDLLVGSLAA